MISDVYKEYEEKKQNELMLKRLEEIYIGGTKKFKIERNSIIKEKKSPTDWNTNSSNSPIKDTKRKWELFKMTQDNQRFLKRLIDSKPSFNTKTKFSKLNGKKHNSSDSLININEKFLNKNEQLEDKKNFPLTIDFSNRTDEDFFKFTKNNFMQKKPSKIILDLSENSIPKEDKKVILYARKAFISNLYIANIEFVLEDKK